MIQYLENLLREKTQGSQSEILHAQWIYDKKVIPSALQSVSNLFPHYSLHDESHSATIVNNIVRVIGKDNIEKLSAIDVWLILEAAYCHDLGMVVPSEMMLESLHSENFLSFFKDLLKDHKNGLHEFAKNFTIEDGKIKFTTEIFSLEIIDSIKFILAEYFRRIHAERSKKIIVNPSEQLSIASPRGVIPPRIWQLLGDICACHTKSFDDVMALPFSAVGVDIEDAHPRFIACLLRIGDLLDLDNNRFSEVMLRTLSKVPIDTLHHKSKHLSIETFRADKEKIEIMAKCNDYDVANITQHWFNYINMEVSQQMVKWNEIVPYKELCYLPTIGDLKVELEHYDYIDGKNKPKFNVDTDKALGLLKGAGIYDGAHQCVREILQNAVDATLIRIWLEEKQNIVADDPHSLTPDIISKYPISVNIVKSEEIDDEYQSWEITVKDSGIGISSDDLKFLMKTGSSSKNKHKIAIEESMPTWMRPSGTFGIGFQSIFMLTELVSIETKSFFDEQFQIIELNSPDSKKDGDVLIRKIKSDHSKKPHTQLQFKYKTKKIPAGYSVSSGHSVATKTAHNYDPFTNESLDIELGKIIDEVISFAQRSYFPVNLFQDGVKIQLRNAPEKKFKFYDKENALEFNIYPTDGRRKLRNRFYYKNQYVEDNYQSYSFLGFEVNIHKDKASEVLTLNRNKIRKEYNKKLLGQIPKSLFNIIISNFDNIFHDEIKKQVGSMFLNLYSQYDDLKSIDVSDYLSWEDYLITYETGGTIKLKKLIDSTEVLKLIFIKNNSGMREYYDKYSMIDGELTIKFPQGRVIDDFTYFVFYKLREEFKHIKEIIYADDSTTVVYSKKSVGLEGFIDIEKVLLNLKYGNPYSSRAFIPCIEEFKCLRLKDDAYYSYVYTYIFEDELGISLPKMLSPYVRIEESFKKRYLKVELNEKVYEWVFENRFDKATTIDQIKEGYSKFVSKFDLKTINEAVSSYAVIDLYMEE